MSKKHISGGISGISGIIKISSDIFGDCVWLKRLITNISLFVNEQDEFACSGDDSNH